jgi:hypothetical protein
MRKTKQTNTHKKDAWQRTLPAASAASKPAALVKNTKAKSLLSPPRVLMLTWRTSAREPLANGRLDANKQKQTQKNKNKNIPSEPNLIPLKAADTSLSVVPGAMSGRYAENNSWACNK